MTEFHWTMGESVFAVGMGCVSIVLDDLLYAALAAIRARRARKAGLVPEVVVAEGETEPCPRHRKVARWVQARWAKHLERSWIADIVD